MANHAKKALTTLLGQCVPSVKSQASKIRIRRMELDENLLMVCDFNVHILLELIVSLIQVL